MVKGANVQAGSSPRDSTGTGPGGMRVTRAAPLAGDARPRSHRRRAFDALFRHALKLPEPQNDVVRTDDLPVVMRDGAVLLADHLAPVGPARGTVLIRGPYGFGALGSAASGGLLATHGYHVVLVRTRGTFGSGGGFSPFSHEVEDGADTVAWLRQQPFYTGRFATFGGSYLALTQWAMLMDPPPDLAACVMQAGPHDMSRAIHAGGAVNLDSWLAWCDQMTHQEQMSAVGAQLRAARAGRRLLEASRTLPLVDAAVDLCDGRATWFPEWVTHRDLDDPFWQHAQYGAALDRVDVPVLLQTGWQDVFLDQTLEQYARLSQRGTKVGLTVGPWTHLSMGSQGSRTLIPEALAWLAQHLDAPGPAKHLPRRPAVRIQLSGNKEVRDLTSWPPPAEARPFYPHPDGSLQDQPAGTAAPPVTFTYDPKDPTPTIGGPLLTVARTGCREDNALSARDDAVSFTSAPLATALEVIGVPVVELLHSSDNEHADLFVRLSEVDPRGRSRSVSEGFVRLSPTEATGANGPVELRLWAVGHHFAVGSRIRLIVAGGSFPRFARNLGTSQDPAASTAMATSTRTIRLSGSRLTLPVIAATAS